MIPNELLSRSEDFHFSRCKECKEAEAIVSGHSTIILEAAAFATEESRKSKLTPKEEEGVIWGPPFEGVCGTKRDDF